MFNTLLASIRRLIRQGDQLHMDLTALQAAVAAETTVDASVETLLTTLATQLSAANATSDQGAINTIVAQMQNNAALLGAAVAANTAPTKSAGTPTPTPTPPAAS